MKKIIEATAVFLIVFVCVGKAETCEQWINSVTYNSGSTIIYEGEGYIANRLVYQNTPPDPDDNEWFWSPYAGCGPAQQDLWGIAPNDSDNIYNLNDGSVGVGINPTGDAKLEVSTRIRVYNMDDATNRYADYNHSGIAIVNNTNNEHINIYDGQIVLIGSQFETYISPGSFQTGNTSLTGNFISSGEIKTDVLSPKSGGLMELGGALRSQGTYGRLTIHSGELMQSDLSGSPLLKINNGDLFSSGEIYTTHHIHGRTIEATDRITTRYIEARESIKTLSLTITDQDWSDYVFKTGHKLKSLEEVESFIQENGHLPGIPSESDVKKNGVNVGDMQAKLLARIEEMTLHMIRMQKKINNLESKLTVRQ